MHLLVADAKKRLKHGLNRRMTSMQIQFTNTTRRGYQILKIAYSINGSLKRNTITLSSGSDIDKNLTWLVV